MKDYWRLARLLEEYDTAMGKDRDWAKASAARHHELILRAESAERALAEARQGWDENVVIFAFRYCLGRMSTAPSHFVAWVTPLLPGLSGATTGLMRQEITWAIRHGHAGMNCDVEEWNKLLAALPAPPAESQEKGRP